MWPVLMVYAAAMLYSISSADTNGSKLLLPESLMCLNLIESTLSKNSYNVWQCEESQAVCRISMVSA